MVVGALIFVLGIDLVKEALWDTRHRVSRTEYITIVSIMICMTVYDFVIGVLFGILISCRSFPFSSPFHLTYFAGVFFVVQSSRSRSIRTIYTGESAMSSVRRPSAHRDYLREVAKQTTVVRLQGFLFFGTCTSVEETIRRLLDPVSWNENPIRFLVLDLALVPGVDVSSAEALIRIQRLLAAKECILVLCGLKVDSPVGRSLASVELLRKDNVELFETLSDGLECKHVAPGYYHHFESFSRRDGERVY
jgi:SulP family sulfate permease